MALRLRFLGKLAVACAAALALPSSALAADASVFGPAIIGEGQDAVYAISCGDTPNPLAPANTTPIPNTGRITVTVTAESATKDADYTEPPETERTVACSAETPSATVKVPIRSDGSDEPDTESFKVAISATFLPPGAVDPAKSSVTTVIDDGLPVATVTGLVRMAEGDAGTSNATLSVSLDRVSWQEVTVAFSTQSDTATAPADYIASNGSLKIPAGSTTGTITVPIVGDTTNERAESFFVNLGDNPIGAAYDNTKRQGLVVIFDNDPPPVPVFSIGKSQRVTEGNTGTVNLIFTVTLSPSASERTQIAWRTASWTARLGDYTGGQGILVFERGETSKTISVDVKGDRREEPTEMFAVILSGPVGGTLGQDKALGIIEDDDGAAAGPKVGIGKPTREGRTLASLLTCPDTATACRGKLVARAGRLKVGKTRFELAKGGKTDLALKISRKAFRKLKKRSLRVKFKVVARNEAGARGVAKRTFRIKKIRSSAPTR